MANISIDTEQMKAIIRTKKNKWSRPFRNIFWTQETNDAIKAWLAKQSKLRLKRSFVHSDAVFVSTCGIKIGKRFTNKGVGEMLRRYCNKAEIPNQNTHSFRHNFAHTVLKKGGSAADVMNLLGHASLDSSTIYTTMHGDELEERYNKEKTGRR